MSRSLVGQTAPAAATAAVGADSTLWQDVVVQYTKPLNCMSVDPRGRWAALGSKKGSVYLVDLEEPWEFARSLSFSTLSPHRTASGASGSGSSGVVQQTTAFSSSGGEVNVLAWNPHLERATIIAAAAGKDLMLFNIEDRRSALHTSLQTHQRPVADISWSLSDPNVLASCSADTYINVWDFRDTRRPLRLKSLCGWTSPVSQVKFNRRHPFLLASSHDSEVRIWDIRREAQPLLRHVGAHAGPITQLEWLNSDILRQPHLSNSVSDTSNALLFMTTSLDRTLRLWAAPPQLSNATTSASPDYEGQQNTPTSLILISNTQFQHPIGKARFVPSSLSGSASLSVVVASMKGSDYTMRLLTLTDSSSSGSGLCFADAFAFAGHTDIVTSVDWRVVGDKSISSQPTSLPTQLASWSARDQQFRLWCIPATVSSKLRQNTSIANAITASLASVVLSNTQPHASQALAGSPSGGLLSSSSLSALSLQRETPSLPQLLTPLLAQPLSPGNPPTPSSIQSLSDWELAATPLATLEQELALLSRLNIVSHSLTPNASTGYQQLVSISFEEISATKRAVIATISVSQQLLTWPDASDLSNLGAPSHVSIRVRIIFPSLYPHSASPSLEVQSLSINHVNMLSSSSSAAPSPSPSPSSFSSPFVSLSPSSQPPASANPFQHPWGTSPSTLFIWVAELKEAWAETNVLAVESSRPCLYPLFRDTISFLRSFISRISRTQHGSSAPATPVKTLRPQLSFDTEITSPQRNPTTDISAVAGPATASANFDNLAPINNPLPLPVDNPPESRTLQPVAEMPGGQPGLHLAPAETPAQKQQAYLQSAGEISLLSHQVAISLSSTPASPYNKSSQHGASDLLNQSARQSEPLELRRLGHAPATIVSSARGATLPENIQLAQNAESIPSPRWCGSVWSPTGCLLLWGRNCISSSTQADNSFSSPQNTIPRTWRQFSAWKADVIARSRAIDLRRQQRVRDQERRRHEAEGHSVQTNSCSTQEEEAVFAEERDPIFWNARVAVVDASLLLPVSPFLARAYRLHGHISIARMCAENAEVARLVGRHDLLRAWSLLALQSNASITSNTHWAFHPLGQKLIRELANHYEQIGDVQMLAMMACTLSGPLHAPRISIAKSKSALVSQHRKSNAARARDELRRLFRCQQRERHALLLKQHRQRVKLRQQLTSSTSGGSTVHVIHFKSLQAKHISQQEQMLFLHLKERAKASRPLSWRTRSVDSTFLTPQPKSSSNSLLESLPLCVWDERAIRAFNIASRRRRADNQNVESLGRSSPSVLFRLYRLNRFSRLRSTTLKIEPSSVSWLWRRLAPRRHGLATSADVSATHPAPQSQIVTPFEFYDADSDVSRELSTSSPEMKPLASPEPPPSGAQVCMIDGYDMSRFDVYKSKYADILFSWGLLQERAELMKYLRASDPRTTHAGPIFGVSCRRCSGEVAHGSFCRQCSCYALECSLCRLPVKGAMLFCYKCGHGGHSMHLREWFSSERTCPSGCGCSCQPDQCE